MPRVRIHSLYSAGLIALCLAFAGFAQQPQPSPQTATTNAGSQEIENLVTALAAAKTEAERASLLAAKKELVTIELRKALHARADREREQGHEALAFDLYQLAKNIAKQIDDTAGLAAAFEEIGLAYYNRDEYDLAMNALKETLRLCEQLKDVRKQAGTFNQIGMVHRAKGEYPQAIESYQQAQTLNAPLGDKKVLLQTLINLGIVYRQRGDYEAALQVYQQALLMQETTDNKSTLARLLNSIGNVYWSQSDYAQAIEHFQKSLKLSEEAKEPRLSATLLNNLGESYADMGDDETALDYYRKSLALAETNHDKRQMAGILSNIGKVEQRQQAFVRATESYQKSLRIREDLKDKAGVAETLERLALLQNESGQHADALASAERAAVLAKEIGRRETFWRARTIAGKIYRALNRSPEARQAFDEAISVIEDLRRQVAGGEESQQRYFEDRVSPYYEMVDLLVGENRAEEALRYAERAKARVLLDVLQRGRRNVTKRMTEAEQLRENSLKDDLVALNAQVQRAGALAQADNPRLTKLQAQLNEKRLEYTDFQTKLYAAHPELKLQRGESRPVTLDELSGLVPDAQTALIEYVIADERTLLFIITKADPAKHSSSAAHGQVNSSSAFSLSAAQQKSTPDLHVYTINVKRAELTKRVALYRQQLAERNLLFSGEAKGLYQLLLAPAAAQLQNLTRLNIVPDGALWELPFQSLLSPQNKYVVERHAVSYAPSLSVLGEMRRVREQRMKRRADTSVLFALGNPTPGSRRLELSEAKDAQAKNAQAKLMDTAFTELPEAERQVRLLAALYPAASSKIYVGAEASEERLKREAANFRILHLATHGVLDNANPLYSYVLLAGSTGNPATGKNAGAAAPRAIGDDGLLEAWEMMQLDLHADMVVLSACETARGRIVSGEGLIGMSWALFVAGSPMTIASQWKVESSSATELMLTFYRNLQPKSIGPNVVGGNISSSRSKAEALRQASIALLRTDKYAHPFYWAGFDIIGDGD